MAPQLHAISYATLKGISGCAKCVGFCMWLSCFPNLQISFLNSTLRADPSVLHALESLEVCLKLCRTLHEFPLLQRKIDRWSLYSFSLYSISVHPHFPALWCASSRNHHHQALLPPTSAMVNGSEKDITTSERKMIFVYIYI